MDRFRNHFRLWWWSSIAVGTLLLDPCRIFTQRHILKLVQTHPNLANFGIVEFCSISSPSLQLARFIEFFSFYANLIVLRPKFDEEVHLFFWHQH